MAASGMDPSQMDPAMMGEMMQMMQRLPRGKMIKLQGLVQKAMRGQDVTREMMVLQKTLPPQFQQFMQTMTPGMGMPDEGEAISEDETEIVSSAEATPKDLSVEEARSIVEEALASGKISKEEADQLLSAQAGQEKEEEKKSGFWNRIRGK